ncbi:MULTISPECIES: type II toxin-antitoxin system prevent-host-death family antitoxin [unclassified Novosphingobium]|uniref:type II toxin-antitoxin system Phd/YefM family antitoxin n=1 Tax=unclassified Novosphingobium TaxID=2644732 RepID=UPI000EEA98C8|nr:MULTISPECIES: type II toxin-antitoxin system prevent-host-death family antitoxin [unclassified Novosphingobium]HCF25034.1 antitoxin [Novosphingobium sp.]HQV01943.1 type II toxin-antitoxin system prevent-host-death family antitoxin [Novosphingobium sp.]
MTTVTVHEAKTNLSRLIAAVLAGEEVVIARGKVPAVKLVPIEPKPKRVPGLWKGKVEIGPEFFEPMSDDELAQWEGRDDEF